MQKQYYYNNFGMQAGPIDEEVLLSMLRTGKILFSTVVWREGMAEWKTAAQVFPELVASTVAQDKVKREFKPTPRKTYICTCASLGFLILFYIELFKDMGTGFFLSVFILGTLSAIIGCYITFGSWKKLIGPTRIKALEYGTFNLPLLLLFIILFLQNS